MEIFLTVISGTLIFVIGQILLKFFIEPIYLRKLIVGEIADCLIFYGKFYCNDLKNDSPLDKNQRNDGSLKLKSLSTQLIAKTNAIPFCLELFDLSGTKDAARELIAISNRMLVSNDADIAHGVNLIKMNYEGADKIFNLLRIKFKPD